MNISYIKILVVIILFVSCKADPEKELSSKSIEFNHEAFLKYVGDGNIDIVSLFIDAGINVNQAGANGSTPLIFAIKNNQVEMSQYLIENGALFWIKDNTGTAPITYAAQNNLKTIVAALMAEGAYIDEVDNQYDLTPLIYTIGNKHNDLMEYLIVNGANINYKNKDGGMPIHTAAAFNNAVALKRLLELGADPNAQISNGVTPLHLAANDSSLEILKILLESGADKTTKDKSGNLPRDYALNKNQNLAAKLLE